MFRASSLVGCLLLAQASFAGQVILKNGEILKGEFKSLDADNLVWQSEELGEIRIAKGSIDRMSLDSPVKLRGIEEPCSVKDLADQYVTFVCDEDGAGVEKRIPLLTLQYVVPYVGHDAATYLYGGNLRASGWKQTGNTESQYWEVLTNVRMRHDDLRHKVLINMNGQKTETEDAQTGLTVETKTQAAKATYTFDWFFQPQWYWSNQVSAETDDNLNIQEKYVAGSGLGYQFWETDTTALALEGGLQYSRTYLEENPPADEPEAYTSARLGADFRYRFANEVKMYHRSEYIHSLEAAETGASERWEFRTDTGFNFPIGYGVSADVSVKWDYINYAEDLGSDSNTDTIYRLGINYSW